jgi:hypothetical protein
LVASTRGKNVIRWTVMLVSFAFQLEGPTLYQS